MSQNQDLLLQTTLPSVEEKDAARLAQATARLVQQTIAAQPQVNSGLRIYLHGGLGAGKTTWTRYFLQACGVTGRIKSPSFSVVESYDIQDIQVHHLDFYRQSDPQAWQGGGLRDVIAERAISIIEWPEHAASLPPADIDIAIDWANPAIADGPRRFTIRLYRQPHGFDMASFVQEWQASLKAA